MLEWSVGVLSGVLGSWIGVLEWNLKTKITLKLYCISIFILRCTEVKTSVSTKEQQRFHYFEVCYRFQYPGSKCWGRWRSYPCHNFDLNTASAYMCDDFGSNKIWGVRWGRVTVLTSLPTPVNKCS